MTDVYTLSVSYLEFRIKLIYIIYVVINERISTQENELALVGMYRSICCMYYNEWYYVCAFSGNLIINYVEIKNDKEKRHNRNRFIPANGRLTCLWNV